MKCSIVFKSRFVKSCVENTNALTGPSASNRRIERQQAPDHSILWGVPETHYLDFFLFQVV